MTSKYHAVLFTKKACTPCTETHALLNQVLTKEPELGPYVSTMLKDNHTALTVAYELDTYPTLMVVDKHGEETFRMVGGKKIREYLPGILHTIQAIDKNETCCRH